MRSTFKEHLGNNLGTYLFVLYIGGWLLYDAIKFFHWLIVPLITHAGSQ